MAIPTNAGAGGNLQTVQRALQVLELFTAREPEWGLTEVAERLAISKSMAHRLLATLMDHGFLQQHPRSKRYRLGLRLLGLGALVGDRLEIRRVALPHMEALARGVGETVFLTVVDRRSALAVARVEGEQSVNWLMGIGENFPLTRGATNKVLLAYLQPAEQEEILTGVAMPAEAEAIRADLAEIRQQGYAFSVGEVTFQTAAAAVPIISPQGGLIAGLSLAGPMARVTSQRLPDLVAALQETALRIAQHYPYAE